METSRIGMVGERVAEVYLKKIGHRILKKNFRKKWGEIDIISISPDGVLVFTEVKSSLLTSGTPLVSPEDHMTSKKIHSLRKMSEFFFNRHEDISDNGFRIDFISVRVPKEKIILLSRLPSQLLTRFIKCCDVSVTENI